MPAEPGYVPDPANQKRLGAYYTPAPIARELARWAIRDRSDTVLDPSFGGCAFLDAAAEQLELLGASPSTAARQLVGIEVDDTSFASAATRRWRSRTRPTLLHQDFLTTRPGEHVAAVDAVMGNPPYLRYQGFNAGAHGMFSRLAAAAASVDLSAMASSWAAFVVHATRFVNAGGRLAHIVPGQFLHAQYAAPVRDFLVAQFARVVVVVFEERVFPGAQEEVVLVLAEGRGSGPCDLEFHSCSSVGDLDVSSFLMRPARHRCSGVDRGKLLAELLPAETRALYSRLEHSPMVSRLGDWGDVDIGTVTGANSFFVLAQESAAHLHPSLLQNVVSKAAHVRSARLTKTDFGKLVTSGARCQLLLARSDMPEDVLATAGDHFAEGELDGLHHRNKCRGRKPWWAIRPPRNPVPDILLTYCVHDYPRLVLNEARVMHTNTLHGLTLHDSRTRSRLTAGFYNSLTMLSAELVARSYGGGVLKLEPTEAEALLLPPLRGFDGRTLLRKVDRLIRAGQTERALGEVDEVVLERALGLSSREVRMLRAGTDRLRHRRHARRRPPG